MPDSHPTLQGIFPILATCFHPDGAIDYKSQERLIQFCIDSGVHGLVMLANASEGHLLSETEKADLLDFGLKIIQNRIPVIATVNHPSAYVVSQTAARAEALGASAVMTLPPFLVGGELASVKSTAISKRSIRPSRSPSFSRTTS